MTDPNTHLPIGKLPAELLGTLLDRYRTPDPTVVVGPGIGGDAAAIAVGNTVLVVKSDPITFVTEGAARYLVDVNANDLACLGARPRWLVVTALLPAGETTVSSVEAQFRDLAEVCRERSIALVGGHTEITTGLDRPILVGVLLGEVAPEALLRPGGGRPGDRLLLTKALAIEGTALLARELKDRLQTLEPSLLERAASFLDDPGISVGRDAAALARAGGVTALHDSTEGGLASAVREIGLAAGCGAVIELEAVPITPETRAIASALGLDPLGMLASGSLLAAADPQAVDGLVAAGAAEGVEVTPIGTLTDEPGRFRLRGPEGEVDLPAYATDEVARALAAAGRGGSA